MSFILMECAVITAGVVRRGPFPLLLKSLPRGLVCRGACTLPDRLLRPMAGAPLSKPRQDSTPLQRLRAVDASTWAKLAFALLCVLALFGYFAFPTYPTYDS